MSDSQCHMTMRVFCLFVCVFCMYVCVRACVSRDSEQDSLGDDWDSKVEGLMQFTSVLESS